MQIFLFKTGLIFITILSLSACADRLGAAENKASSGTASNGINDKINAAEPQYTGGMKDGKYDGKGVLIKPNKDRLEGTFKVGLLEGLGLFVGANGDSYEGLFVGGVYSGKGRWESKIGAVYAGTFKDGRLNGDGTITNLNGEVYSGNVEKDLPSGRGTFTFENGDVYVGEFKSGVFHGAGKLTFKEPRTGGKPSEAGITTQFVEGEWKYGRLVDADKANALTVENFIYDQPTLLKAQIESLKPSQPSQTAQANMYFLGVAGDGAMEVFRREVQSVERQFAQNFSTAGRSIVLANTTDYASDFPMANQISLQRALDAMAKQMDKQNDILFLFMTSHGSKEHEFALQHPYARVKDLPAKTLATMLESTGIRHKVIVVSACYSGGFIEPLKNDYHLILTAARRDRSSFGCATENNFTYFGRAFFNESLPVATSFQDAFERAKISISQWEARDFAKAKQHKNYLEERRKRLNVPPPEVKPVAKLAEAVSAAATAVTKVFSSADEEDNADAGHDDGDNKPSLPQIYVGKKIAPVLENWWKLKGK